MAEGGVNHLAELAAELCKTTILQQPYPNESALYCDALWDGWGCWNYTKAGDVSYIPCPSYIQGFDSKYEAHRYCTESGEWWRAPTTNNIWANYTGCVDLVGYIEAKRVMAVYITGYAVSIISLVVALAIFIYFRQLQCNRVTLHKNLFTCYILNGIVWILYYTLVASNSSVLDANPIWCQAIHCLAQYFTTCNFFWMFCEGLYLHTVIVVAFATGKKLLLACYLIGWGIPVLTTTVYVTIRALDAEESTRCWLEESILAWFAFGPIVATLILNMIFMINIVRVLVSKLRAVNSPDTTQTRKAVRAALILIPLLGLQFILYPVTPARDSKFFHPYQLITAFVTSFQGLFVAVIFCFLNGEVSAVIRRRWGQHRLMRRGSFKTQNTYMDTNVENNGQQRKRGSSLNSLRKAILSRGSLTRGSSFKTDADKNDTICIDKGGNNNNAREVNSSANQNSHLPDHQHTALLCNNSPPLDIEVNNI